MAISVLWIARKKTGKENKIWYIFKGTSCHGDRLEYDCETDQDVKTRPCGFYDLVSPEDTICGGIKVIEYTEYQALVDQLKKAQDTINAMIKKEDF